MNSNTNPGDGIPGTAGPFDETEQQKLLTQLVYVLLATEPIWKRLPDPGPLMGEEFLCAVLEAGYAGPD